MTTPTIPVPVDVLRELVDGCIQEHINDDDGRPRTAFKECGPCDASTGPYRCNPYPPKVPDISHHEWCPIPALREQLEKAEER